MTDRAPNKLTQADYDDFVTSFSNADGYTYEKAGGKLNSGYEVFLPCFINPDHNSRERIYDRVVLLDRAYSTQFRMDGSNVFIVFTDWIYNHRAEFKRLAAPDVTDEEINALVCGLANANAENGRRAFSFATKYCAHVNPNRCPIYDNIVGKVFKGLGESKRIKKINGENPEKTFDYADYIKLYNEFKDTYTTGLTFRQIDKILWWVGKERKEEMDKECYRKLRDRFLTIIPDKKRIAPNK